MTRLSGVSAGSEINWTSAFSARSISVLRNLSNHLNAISTLEVLRAVIRRVPWRARPRSSSRLPKHERGALAAPWQHGRHAGPSCNSETHPRPHARPGPRVPPIADGNRSLVFRFDSLEEDSPEPVNFGAVIRQPGTSDGGTTGIVELHFWADLAAVYATKATPFLLWYGGIVGRGEIVDVLDPAAGDAQPEVAVDLTPEERRLLIAGIGDWGGPTRCSDALAQLMGFSDVEGLYRDGRGLRERLSFEEPLTARDWGRSLLATELCFAVQLRFHDRLGDHDGHQGCRCDRPTSEPAAQAWGHGETDG